MEQNKTTVELEQVKAMLYPLFFESVFSLRTSRFEDFSRNVLIIYSEKNQGRLNGIKLSNDLEKIRDLFLRVSIDNLTLEANKIYSRKKWWDGWEGKNLAIWHTSIHKSIGLWLSSGPNSNKVHLLTLAIDHHNQIEQGMEVSPHEEIPLFEEDVTDEYDLGKAV